MDGFRVDVAHGLVKADRLPEWDREQQLINSDGGRVPTDVTVWVREAP